MVLGKWANKNQFNFQCYVLSVHRNNHALLYLDCHWAGYTNGKECVEKWVFCHKFFVKFVWSLLYILHWRNAYFDLSSEISVDTTYITYMPHFLPGLFHYFSLFWHTCTKQLRWYCSWKSLNDVTLAQICIYYIAWL